MPASMRALCALLAIGVCAPSAHGAQTDDEPSAEQVAQQATWQRVIDAGVRSSDLRMRILYSIDGMELRADGMDYPVEAIPVETLVEQARGSTDPMVLSLMVDRCLGYLQRAGRCDQADFATRWTVADTQNQLAWLALASVQRGRGEVEAARASFRRAAQASLWHEQTWDLTRAAVRAIPRAMPPDQRANALGAVLARTFMSPPTSALATINALCKDQALQDACARIVQTMARDAGTLMTVSVSASFAARTELPAATVAAIRQRADAMRWAAHHLYGESEGLSAVKSLSGPADQPSLIEAMVTQGELKVLERELQEAGVSEAEAARRRVASMGPAEVAQRADLAAHAFRTAGPAPAP